MSAFACTTLAATAVGVPAGGALTLGLLGAWSGDWPDIDHPGASVTKSLQWVPYWRDHPRDKKTGDYRRRKDGRVVTQVRYAPALQVHGFFVWLSGAIYDRCATPVDRADTNKLFGPAFRVHRGFTHSVWFALLCGLAWWLLLAPWPIWSGLAPWFGTDDVPLLVAEAFATGALAHILGDGCTDFGVSPWAPLIKWKGRRYPRMGLWEPLRFKVNKKVELLLIAPLCTVLAAYSVLGAFFGPVCVLEALGALVARIWASVS